MAIKRFFNLERMLQRQPDLMEKYKRFIHEFIALGHMKRINDENYLMEKPNFYLPHHAVFKNDSLTTKLRVVFDVSAKSSNGMSLNDNL